MGLGARAPWHHLDLLASWAQGRAALAGAKVRNTTASNYPTVATTIRLMIMRAGIRDCGQLYVSHDLQITSMSA